MENHAAIGGLGSCVADLPAGQGLGKRPIDVSIGDRCLQGTSRPRLVEHYGIGASALVNAVETLAGRTQGFTEDRIVHPAASWARTGWKRSDALSGGSIRSRWGMEPARTRASTGPRLLSGPA